MKLMITGHTSGLGKALWDSLKDQHELIGISRSTGYDLTDHAVVNQVIELSLTVDHVLNVCKIHPAQVDLLLGIHRLWQQNDKFGKIVSIGGLTTTFSWEMIRKAPIHQTDYIAAKHNLAKAHFDLAAIDPYSAQPQSVLIRPLNIGDKGHRNEPFLDETEMVNIVRYALEHPAYISTIDVRQLRT